MNIIDNSNKLTDCSSLEAGTVFRIKDDNVFFIKTDTAKSVDLSNGSYIKVTGMVEEVDSTLIVGGFKVPASEEKYSELKSNINRFATDFCDALYEKLNDCNECPFRKKCSSDSCKAFILDYFNV